jgi:hypothetical protein
MLEQSVPYVQRVDDEKGSYQCVHASNFGMNYDQMCTVITQLNRGFISLNSVN